MKKQYTFIPLISVSLLTTLPFSARAQETYTGIQDATPVQIHLEGNSQYDGWYNFSNSTQTKNIHGTDQTISGLTGYPNNPGNAGNEFPSPIYAQFYSGSHGLAFNKIANANGSGGLDKFNPDGTRNGTPWGGNGFAPYVGADGLYAISFSNVPNTKGGTLGIFNDDVLPDLANIVLQLQIGPANGYDFVNNASSQYCPATSNWTCKWL